MDTVHDPTDGEADSSKPLIVIVSNRGPFSFTANEDDTFDVKRGAGGLVTALSALAEKHEVLWFAAALSKDDRKWAVAHNDQPHNVQGVRLCLVRTQEEAYDSYYNVIANPLLWFIHHQLWDTPRNPNIDHNTWDAWQNGYVAVNKLFADTVVKFVKDIKRPVIIFPQDYHLYLTPYFLRKELGANVQIQPFIHIPWPGPDAWRMLPAGMRNMLLSSLLNSDRVGFQTKRDAFNFVQTCRFYLSDAHSYGSRNSLEYRDRKVEARTYPISIDVEKMDEIAEEAHTRLLKSQLINLIGDRQLILRIDRVEPSKNILRGLLAYRALLEHYPEYRGKVQMLALLVPSRMEVAEYHTYLQEIMAEAGLINAEYSDEFWEPVRTILGESYHRAIAAMQLYDVLLVNPIADGMNLVAKEGVLVNQHDGVLLLSENAGAYYELGEHALSVSPFDIYSTAQALHQALTMPQEERARRAAALAKIVRQAGVRQWFYTQVEDALRAANSQASSDSIPSTPTANKSALSRTTAGISSDSTPTPSE
jgi:trehalose 6-phosphate synthase